MSVEETIALFLPDARQDVINVLVTEARSLISTHYPQLVETTENQLTQLQQDAIDIVIRRCVSRWYQLIGMEDVNLSEGMMGLTQSIRGSAYFSKEDMLTLDRAATARGGRFGAWALISDKKAPQHDPSCPHTRGGFCECAAQFL